jgi:hypothetical protein
MFDGKFLATLIGLLIAVMAVCNFNNKKTDVCEPWDGMDNIIPKAVYTYTLPDGSGGPVPDALIWGGTQGCNSLGPGILQANPSFQRAPNPRYGNVSWPAAIRYNLPDPQYMAFDTASCPGGPSSAAASAAMVTEGYQENYKAGCSAGGCGDSCGPPRCSSQAIGGVDPTNIPGNYNKVLGEVPSSGLTDASLPIGTLKVCDGEGDCTTATFNLNYMYSTRRNRNQSQGDMIRGDLPIVPCNDSWFVPAAARNPSESLQGGAMAVLNGDCNTTDKLKALIDFGTGGWGAPGGYPGNPQPYLSDLQETAANGMFGYGESQTSLMHGDGNVTAYQTPTPYGVLPADYAFSH